MKIGMTYDLKDDYLKAGFGAEETAEFDKSETIDSIEECLSGLGHDVERIGNVKALVANLHDGKRWDLVFNIAEGLRGFGREAQVPAILDAFDIPYTFSDPLVLTLTLHKGMAKHVVRDLGIPTPDFVVVEAASDLPAVSLPYPLFAKPVAEGTSKGIDGTSRIEDAASLGNVCRRLMAEFDQPVLVETYMPGREFTVGIVGTGRAARAIGAVEILLRGDAEPGAYSYVNKENYKKLVEYRLAEDEAAARASETALAVWRGLGCRDAGRVDIRLDAGGVPNFIEVNPLAGLHPENSDICIIANRVGMGYRNLIAEIVGSALHRLNGGGRVR